MSKIEANTIDSISGTSTLTLGSSNASTIALGSGDVQSNFLYPAFEAYLSADTSPSNDTFTKIAANTEVYDTDNAYDNSSNYRFTPQVAGKYFVYVGASATSVNNMYSTIINFTKNGSGYKEAIFQNGTNSSYPLNKLTPTLCGVVDLNGSSDYIESNVNIQTHNGSSITLEGGSVKFTYFGAYRIGT